MEDLLKNWGFEKYIETFKQHNIMTEERANLITKEQWNQIFASCLGDGAFFLHKLENHRKSNVSIIKSKKFVTKLI